MHPLFAIGLPHGSEWLIILVLAILFFGADKLPKLAKGLGKSLGEFKKAKEDFEKEVHAAANEPDAKAGDKLSLGKVLLVADGDKVTVGKPTVAGAAVEATVLAQRRGTRVRAEKFKRRTGQYHRQGHRQYMTTLKIEAISLA